MSYAVVRGDEYKMDEWFSARPSPAIIDILSVAILKNVSEAGRGVEITRAPHYSVHSLAVQISAHSSAFPLDWRAGGVNLEYAVAQILGCVAKLSPGNSHDTCLWSPS